MEGFGFRRFLKNGRHALRNYRQLKRRQTCNYGLRSEEKGYRLPSVEMRQTCNDKLRSVEMRKTCNDNKYSRQKGSTCKDRFRSLERRQSCKDRLWPIERRRLKMTSFGLQKGGRLAVACYSQQRCGSLAMTGYGLQKQWQVQVFRKRQVEERPQTYNDRLLSAKRQHNCKGNLERLQISNGRSYSVGIALTTSSFNQICIENLRICRPRLL